jgi:predicted nucleic acid-binding protein
VIVFFDTSAMVKRYFAEADSDAVGELWSNASLIVASQLLYAEMIATFARKLREEPRNADTIAQMQQAFRGDFLSLTRIAIDDDVHRRVDDLLARHPLRGADAVHLASAVLTHNVLQEGVTFACADNRLVDAARAEGLRIAP